MSGPYSPPPNPWGGNSGGQGGEPPQQAAGAPGPAGQPGQPGQYPVQNPGQPYVAQPYPGQPYAGGPAYPGYPGYAVMAVPAPPRIGSPRSGMLTAGAIVAIVMSSLALVYCAIAFVALMLVAEVDEQITWAGFGDELLFGRILNGVALVASIVAIIAGALTLAMQRGAYFVLLCSTAVALVVEVVMIVWSFDEPVTGAFGVWAVIWLAGTLTSGILMLTPPARRAILADPQSGSGSVPPSSAQFH